MNAPLPTAGGAAARLGVELVDGASAAVAVQAADPLKLLVSTPRGPCVWAYATTYGGGLLAGDTVDLRLAVGAGARLFLGTQSSTKVYRSADGRTATQRFTATIGPGGLLAALPDPVTPFSEARFSQRQELDLDPTAGVMWLDGLTSGRAARAERWHFTDYRSRLLVRVGGVPLLHDALHLGVGLRDVAGRCAGIGAFATLVVGGPPLAERCAALLAAVAAHGLDQRPLVSASPLRLPGAAGRGAAGAGADWGVLVRLAAPERETLDRTVRALLGDLRPLLGDDPWHRRP